MKDENPNRKKWNAIQLTKVGGSLGFLIALLSTADDLTSLVERLATWGSVIFRQDEANPPLALASGNDVLRANVEGRAVHQPTTTLDTPPTTSTQRTLQTTGNPVQNRSAQNIALANLGAKAEIITPLPDYALSNINVENLIDGRASPAFSVPIVTEKLTVQITLPTSEVWAVSAVNLQMPRNTDTREMPRDVEIGEIAKIGRDCTYFHRVELERGAKNNRILFPERVTQKICIDIKTNWGSPRISMSEIEIEATPIFPN